MTPQPGQSLSAEDCKLLEPGDWLLHSLGFTCRLIGAGEYLEVERTDSFGLLCDAPEDFTFLGRPGADGFIPWTGGPRPHPPGLQVEVRFRDGTTDIGKSAFAYWWHEDGPRDILAWRPAPSVEGLGALRPEDRAFVPTERGADSADQLRAAEEDECEECYKIGKRDGYEEAIQDLDLATGGDGEYKVMIPGGVIDMPVMKQRIIDRFAALSASGPAGGGVLQAFADEIARIPITDDTSGDDAYNALNVVVEYARELSSERPDPALNTGDLHGLMFRSPFALSAPGSQKGAGE